MNFESLDPGIQDQINEMFVNITNPNAQEHVNYILQQSSGLVNFSIYLFKVIENQALPYYARTAASLHLRHLIRNIPIELRHIVKQLSASILPPLFASEDPVFINSVAALIAEVASEFGENVFQDFSQTIDVLLSEERTFYTGLSLLFELSSNDSVIQGEYLSNLLNFLQYEDQSINLMTANIVKCLSSKIPRIIKDTVIIPLLSGGNFGELLEDSIVQIIDASCNLLQAFADDYEVSDEERLLIYEFFKFCVKSNHDGYAIPASQAILENAFDFDPDLAEYLFLKISQDDDLSEGTFSLQFSLLIKEIASRDPETASEFFGNLIKENITNQNITLVKSSLRTLAAISDIFGDVSEIFNYVLSQSQGNSAAQEEAIGCVANIGSVYPDFAEPALNAVFPAINHASESVRMEALRSLQVLLSAINPPAEPYIQQFLVAMQRYQMYEGFLIFDTLNGFIANCHELENSPNLEQFITMILTAFMSASTTSPLFDATLLCIRQVALKLPPLATQILSAPGFVDKLVSIINLDFQSRQSPPEENGEENYEAAEAANLTPPVLSFFSACINSGADLSQYGELMAFLATQCANLIANGTSGAKCCGWEFLAAVLMNETIGLDPLLEQIVSVAQNVSGESDDDSVVGNTAFFLYSFIQKVPLDKSVLKTIITNMSRSLLIVKDEDDLKNIASCIMMAMYSMQAPGLSEFKDIPEGANDYLQSIIVSIEETEGVPESVLQLCQTYKQEIEE